MPRDNARRKARVLIIDDDELVRGAHHRVIERAGYDTKAVDSVQKGLEAASVWRPDVILLDLVMPDTRGLEALAMLRGDPATTDALVVACSGVVVETDAPRFRHLGFDAILPKPVGNDLLLARVGEILAERRGIHE